MAKIFISYRRGDSQAMTGRIFDRLMAHYGKEVLQHDEALSAGVDFRTQIEDQLNQADVLLAIVGPRWLGASRSGEADDLGFVGSEIEAALRKRKPVIPIVIGNTEMPSADQLPLRLKDFAFRNALRIDTGRDFDSHMERLIRSIDAILAARPPQPPAASASKSAHVTAERPIPAKPAAAAPAVKADADAHSWPRTSPEYWLDRVASTRRLEPGDQPLIFISFASEDQRWIEDVRAFLDPKMELLQDADGQAYQLWNFSDAKRGTATGDEFPEIVAEKMWRCRAALIIFSSSYFRSNYCRTIELPFLMWRREHQNLMCLPLKLGVLPVDRVRIPSYRGAARSVVIGELIDDRQANSQFANSRHRDMNLKQLREEGIESEIESRFEGIARRVAAILKERYAAVECD
jgi:hypothetical protein